MSRVDWLRRQDRIEEVFVPESAFAEGESPVYPPMYVSDCIRHALGSAMYLRDELPREALIVSALNKYLGEVKNGGHAQFVGNTGWCEEYRADIREGLAILGQDEAARIFRDLETFAARHARRFATNSGAPHGIDPYFREIDRRFATIGASVEVALAAWIRTRPWLRIVPDDEYSHRGIPNHRLREERLEERRPSEKTVRSRLLYLQAAVHANRATGWRRLWWRIRKIWYRPD